VLAHRSHVLSSVLNACTGKAFEPESTVYAPIVTHRTAPSVRESLLDRSAEWFDVGFEQSSAARRRS